MVGKTKRRFAHPTGLNTGNTAGAVLPEKQPEFGLSIIMSNSIHPDLITVALDKVEGFAFERFCQDFLSVIEGRDFVPLGGVKDGGADGIYECGKEKIYYQFTRLENHRDKIRKTITRLKEFGRDITTLYYLTARVVPHIDKEEELLTDKLGALIRIRDNKYIASHINDSLGTIAAYENHLANYTQFLEKIGKSHPPTISRHVQDPSAFVFLQHEVTNRLGNRKLIHSITDTMILWSLSETDPDKRLLMSEEEIRNRIFNGFPWASKLLKGHIRKRLEELRTKNIAGREVRWYRKERKYCLPYETRQVIKSENQADESLRLQFVDELKLIASNIPGLDISDYQRIAEFSDQVINLIFEKQGLLFSHFLSSEDKHNAPPVVADCIDDVLKAKSISSPAVEQYRDSIESVIRNVFYHSSPRQREYLINLSRTYVLLFTLQAEPRIIEYFSSLSAAFRLFLGSDIIVQALSERYLNDEDQSARNLLKMARAAGITMLLSECVLEEVFTHIKGTHYEFSNYFMDIEQYIPVDLARNSTKILIRAYFYAKHEGRVKSWKSFIEQFISYGKLERTEGREELKKYLMAEYGLVFIENSEFESVCSESLVKALADSLVDSDDKKNEVLAYNTALQVYGIYGLRAKYHETSTATEYGLKTWWMTNQTRVIKHTTDIVNKKGHKYIMRPEYILNFIAMSPNCDQVRGSFKSIFPSVFGIQLGHRLRDEVFHKIMADVRQWKGYEPGRITALMSDLSDNLKSDRLKRYDHTLANEQP